tara:strand:+ start:656 stop:1354 length:699 start_codon:yes stop_codon:yes gene_type:complete
MSNLCIIPARGGSKRIPRKNIKSFLGKPIIAYSIEAAINSGVFDEIMVSTDDIEIAEIARKYGAKVPFFRSNQNADDFSSTEDVIIEVLENYENEMFEYVCCIYPTAPFVKSERILEGFNKLKDHNLTTLFPIVSFSYPILRALKTYEGRLNMVWPENEDKRSQDFETYFHDSGQFYWIKSKEFKINRKLFTHNTGFIKLSNLEVQDIDNFEDWYLAEIKYIKINDLQNKEK